MPAVLPKVLSSKARQTARQPAKMDLWMRTIFVSVKKHPKIRIWVLFGDFLKKQPQILPIRRQNLGTQFERVNIWYFIFRSIKWSFIATEAIEIDFRVTF